MHQCKASEAPHGKFRQHSRRGSHPVWTCGVNPAQPSGHQQADTTAHTHTPTHTRQPYLQSCHFPFPPSPDFHRTCPIGMVVFTSCIGIGGEGVCGVGESGIYTCSHARRQAIIWMACVDDMSLFDGPPCDSWPRPFRIYTRLWSLSFFSGPGANTWVSQPDTPAFWMLVAVISGMGGKFHTNHVFPVVCIFPRKPTEDTGREARRTVDDRLPQCRRRDGGTSCQGGVAAWPSASRSSLSILPQTRFAVPSGRTETCAHCRDRRNFPDRGPSWSMVPRSRRESSTQQPAVNVAFLPTALPRAGGGCCHQRPLSKR